MFLTSSLTRFTREVMSQTFYFSGTPVLDIPGRTFPVEQVFLEDILEIVPYSLEENSPYAKKQEKNQGGYGGLDKEIFSGDCRDAYLDSVDAELLLVGEGVKPAKDKQWDEHCTAVFSSYS